MSEFLEGFEDADREAAKAGDVYRAEAGTDAAAILVVVPVDGQAGCSGTGNNAAGRPSSAQYKLTLIDEVCCVSAKA